MDVEIKQMPEQRVGTVRHIGPYNQISEAFARLGAIAGPAGLFARPTSGKRLADGPSYELYLNDPTTTPKDQLRTAIYVPLAD